jgi:excisionase family DNA binding protein
MVHTTSREIDSLLTWAQVASRLGISVQTVRRWVDCGRLPAVRLGPRCLRVRQEDLDEFVRGRTGAGRHRPRGGGTNEHNGGEPRGGGAKP